MVRGKSGAAADKTAILKKARNYSFLLLKFRSRSEQEFIARLKEKFDETTIKKTLAFLKEKGFINDRSFAKTWIEERIKRPLGLRRLEEELKLKGIASRIITEQISEVKEHYSEKEIILNIAREKLKDLEGVELEKAKKRLMACLLSRGFSPETIIEAIEQARVKL